MNSIEHAKSILEEERKRHSGKYEETLCEKPHNNGDNRPEVCVECIAIKYNL